MLRRAIPWILLTGLAVCPSCRRAEPARVRIGEREWRVELAVDEATRTRGLGGRDELAAGTGMLFVFPDERMRSFHMLDCRIPLEIAFISAGLTVVETRLMAVEDDPANPVNDYSSYRPGRFALEVPAGELTRAGVKRGDKVVLLGAAGNAAKAAR